MRVGRTESCEIRIEDDTVSREHATLEALGDGRIRLTDLQSSNGTWVRESSDWRRIEREDLGPEREVRFGEHRAVLRSLLANFPAFVLVTEDGESDIGPHAVTAVIGTEDPPDPRFERPRRNPRTGDIEEQS